eukprot:TRINITY_DN2006_c0_g2_i2.p1 TRINITY_DN2006_c0_g2~~TRINITY_DN2006_c0_g2_i2.p1  ORF type:complete len:402 (-),score=106.72 TRINITY_DN2006_c0_g2_i2:28-1233(-)
MIFKDVDSVLILQISVSDTGLGVPKEKLNLIFEAYEQVDNSITRKAGGTGLGLNICRRIVNIMGGQLWCQSGFPSSLPGSTFFVEVPVSITPSSPSPSSPSSSPSFSIQSSHISAPISVDPSLGLNVTSQISSPTHHHHHHHNHHQYNSHRGSGGELPLSPKWPMDIVGNDISGSPAYPTILSASSDGNIQNLHGANIGVFPFFTGGINNNSNNNNNNNNISAQSPSFLDSVNNSSLNNKSALEPSLDLVSSTSTSTSTSSSSNVMGSGRRPFVLIAEDNVLNQKVIVNLLLRLDVEAEIADNGLAALEKYKQNKTKYSFIIMDMCMPVMDGLSSTARIRAYEQENNLEHVPIIALSAQILGQDKEACMKVGMNAFLEKPVRFAYLQNLIRPILSKFNVKN